MLTQQRVTSSKRLTLLWITGLAAVGCSSDPASPDPQCGVPTVTVSGLPESMVAFQTAQLTAAIQPAECANESVSWSTSAGLAVSATGEVQATHLGGPFTITATVKGVEASQTTSVTMPPVVTDTRWALAWTNDPTSADYAVDPFYSMSTGGAIRSSRSAPGTYAVRFPGLARGAGQREVVQVSAYGSLPRRCRVLSWANDGADLVVQVRCHDYTGTLADTRFTILVTPAGSTQGRSAFVVTPSLDGSGPLNAVTTHSASQGAVDISRTGLGKYRVTFAGLDRIDFAAERETFQVTAYGEGNNWCKINNWGGSSGAAFINIDCYDPAGAPADARFALNMLDRGRPGRRLGYVWSSVLATANYVPSTSYALNSTGGVNSGVWQSEGLYNILWGGLGRIAGSTAETNLVTSYGNDPTDCQVVNWGGSEVTIRCYSPAGTVANSLFVSLWIE